MPMLMEVLEVILPILAPILLGAVLRRKQTISYEGISGMETFVMRYGIPCMLFHAYLTCSFSREVVAGMAAVFCLTLALAVLAFRMRRTARWNYHNLPMLFSITEGGLGVPLFLILFGLEQTFRIASLDLAQTLIGVPIISILSADEASQVRGKDILRRIASVPVAIAMVLGLAMNFSGLGAALEPSGVTSLITAVTSAIAEPVSALMLLCVGYEFQISKENRRNVLQMTGCFLGVRIVFCAAIQGLLCLLPSVQPITRWAVLLFCFLPPSYLSVNLGRTQRDNAFAASVCSISTFATLVVFCIIAIAV